MHIAPPESANSHEPPVGGELVLALLVQLGGCEQALRREILHVFSESPVSIDQLVVLWLCSRDRDLAQNQIAQHTGLSTAKVSGLVESLRKADCLAPTRDPEDRRRQVWQVTAAGRDLLRQLATTLLPDESNQAAMSTAVDALKQVPHVLETVNSQPLKKPRTAA